MARQEIVTVVLSCDFPSHGDKCPDQDTIEERPFPQTTIAESIDGEEKKTTYSIVLRDVCAKGYAAMAKALDAFADAPYVPYSIPEVKKTPSGISGELQGLIRQYYVNNRIRVNGELPNERGALKKIFITDFFERFPEKKPADYKG